MGTPRLRTLRLIASEIFAADPLARLLAARSLAPRKQRAAVEHAVGWPPLSPASVNAWLLLVTTKSPSWRDPLLKWPDGPPTLGTPHEGFFYPDPLGFWTEVRRWTTALLRTVVPRMPVTDAVSLAALVHIGDEAGRVAWAQERCQPFVTLYLDETARLTAGVEASDDVYSIPDPHRPGTVYEGWWRRSADGRAVGKSPQHPASHNFYRPGDMDVFLGAVPIRR